MTVSIDEIGFTDGAVIHPYNDVARRIAAGPYGQRVARGIEHYKRACGIEAQALERLPRQAGSPDRLAHRFAGGAPDVPRGLLHDPAGFIPNPDLSFCTRQ